MLGQFEDFFVELAQVFKKHQVVAIGRLPITFMEDGRIIGQYKIIEAWIDKEGEAVIRVKSNDHECSTKLEHEIYSDNKNKVKCRP